MSLPPPSPDSRRTVFRLGVVLYRNDPAELQRLFTSFDLNRESPGSPEFEVAFLDNSPEAGLLGEVQRWAPTAAYEHCPANLGFGAGHNRMMRAAFADPAVSGYVCVNPDAVLHPDCLRELHQEARRQASPGLVEALQFPDEHPKAYDPTTHESAWCSGCVLLITRPAYDALGGFDENFFMYCEDVDLSWRARALGLSTSTAPRALAHHHVGDRAPSTRAHRELLKSGVYLARKFGNAVAADRWLEAFVQLGGDPRSIPPAGSPPAQWQRVADFEHGFTMTEARW